jgi:glycosyltransferase involved in cell wall biosynthesis
MKIGITTFGCDHGKSGIGRYAAEITTHLALNFPDVQFEIVGFENDKTVFFPNLENTKWLTVSSFFEKPLNNIFWHQLNFYRLAKSRKWDVAFLPAGNRRLPFFSPCPTAAVVHDFSALHVSNKYDSRRMFYIKHVLPMLMKRISKIITISSSSRNDIVNYAGISENLIDTIFHGVDHKSFHTNISPKGIKETLSNFSLDKPYLLYISRIEHPGKNHLNLIKGFEIFKKKTNSELLLVLAGSDWNRAELVHEYAKASEFSSDIRFTGFFPGNQLPTLLAGCEAFIFPSLYEGFGMPILEAMAAGKPVACSDISSLPEVAGDAAILFDPNSIEEISNSILKIVSDERLRNQLKESGLKRAAKFTWTNSALETMESLKKAMRGCK